MVRSEAADAPALETHLCGPEDRAEQARLFNACFKKRLGERELVWRYDENPHGRAVSFLARTPEGTGVCGYACSPRRAVPEGDESQLAPIGETGDVMTHPDWRKRGIFSGLDRACMAETKRLGWPLAFGLPNRRSAHIFLELGWERIGTIRPWTHVLRADAAARAARIGDGRLKTLFVPLDAAIGRRARSRLRRAAGARFELRRLDAFPREVVELSRVVEERHSLMVRRDAAYLDWRFLRNVSGLHEAFGLFEGERFAGYVVVQRPREESATGYLVDALAPDAAALDAAFEAGLERLAACGASVAQATAIDGTSWQRELARAGFRPPKRENHLIVILHVHRPEHPLVAAARDVRRWYLTDGDRDDETMG